MVNIILVFFCCFIGSAIQGATGFGFGVFVMSVLPLFLPVQVLSPGVNLLSVFNASIIVFKKRKHIKLKLFIIPVIASIVARNIGIYILMNIDTATFKVILGIVLIAVSIYFMLFSNIKIKGGKIVGAIIGFVSGLLGGTFNMSGPPLVLYYLSITEDKDIYMATIQMTFFITTLYTTALFAMYGRLTADAFKIAGIGFIAVYFGSRVGLHIFSRFNREVLTKFIYVFLAIMGIVMITSA